MSCQAAARALDSRGVDATVIAWGDFPDSYRTEVSMSIQLKATIKPPADKGDFLSYSFGGVERYRELSKDCHSMPRIVMVLFLPKDAD